MTLSLDIPNELLKRLQVEADRRGLTVDEVVAEFAERLPAEVPQEPKKKLSFIGIGESTDGRSARDVDEMLAEGFGQD